MATDIVQSLFGLTPDAYQQAQQDRVDAQALAYAKIDPYEKASYSIGRGASGLASAVGGMLGGQDPQLQLLSNRQAIASQIDYNNQDSINLGRKQLSDVRDIEGLLMLNNVAEKFAQGQDIQQKRADELQARRDLLAAQQVASGAYKPDVQPSYYGSATNATLLDDTGNVMPGASLTPTGTGTYDIKRVAPELMRTAAGRSILQGISKTSEESAKADKALADATVAQAAVPFANSSARADAQKKLAEAEKSSVDAQFALPLAQLGLTQKNWDIKNLQSLIGDRSAKLKLDTLKVGAEVQQIYANIADKLGNIPADTRKLINESATTAAASKQSANQMNDLANRIENLGNYGKVSSFSEFAKSAIGIEGYETSLRQEYVRIRNSSAIKALPPGPATDKDIQLALSGFPKDTSNSTLVASFLRGMAKMQDIDAAVNTAKTDWFANNNGTLTRSNKTFVAGDYSVRPGETFNDFSARIADDVSSRVSGKSADAQRQSRVNRIPTNQPVAASTSRNVMVEADAILRGR